MHSLAHNSSFFKEIIARHAASVASFAIVLFAFFWLRTGTPHALLNIDELIAPSVVHSMIDRLDLNGNWRLATELPSYFQYDQHNFYAYHLIAIPFAASDDPMVAISKLRALNVVLQGAAAALIALALWLSKVPILRIMLVFIAITVTPVMVFDAHIARTESLLYLLFAGLCATSASRLPLTLKFALFGALLGFGAASKVTFLAAGLIAFPEVIYAFMEQRRRALLMSAIATIGVTLGFVVGNPYSILEPHIFLSGVRSLMEQYSTGHPPHSWPGSGIIDHASHLVLFAVVLTGATWLTIYVRPTVRTMWLVGVAAFSAVTLAYFATKPVFFERNIGLALFGASVVAFSQPRRRLVSSCLYASLIVMAWWSWSVADAVKNRGVRLETFETATFGATVPRSWPYDNAGNLLAQCTGVVGVFDYHDRSSQRITTEVASPPIATFEGRFSLVPTSTLHTYLESTVHYFECEETPP